MSQKSRLFAMAASGCALAAVVLMGASENAAAAPSINSLRVTITTTNRNDAGTDATIYLVFTLKDNLRNPRTSALGGRVMKLPDQPGDDNETGKTTTYEVKLPDGSSSLDTLLTSDVTPENLLGITLVNGMNDDSPGWHVASIKIEGFISRMPDDNGEHWMIVNQTLNRWLDTKEQTGPAAPLKVLSTWQFFKGE